MTAAVTERTDVLEANLERVALQLDKVDRTIAKERAADGPPAAARLSMSG